VVADVSAPEYRSSLESVQASRGPFDLCFYCAGIGERFDPLDFSRDPLIFRVNLLGLVDTASVVLPPMIAAAHGHFVGLSSIGDGVSSEAPSYGASKAGFSSYLEGLGLALRARGVCVTNVRLGFVDTKMAKARLRPFMMTVERATEVILRCIQQRPARLTYPKSMAALAWLLGRFRSMSLWFR
jgi:short-subunit dehydrogenase